MGPTLTTLLTYFSSAYEGLLVTSYPSGCRHEQLKALLLCEHCMNVYYADSIHDWAIQHKGTFIYTENGHCIYMKNHYITLHHYITNHYSTMWRTVKIPH